MAEPTYQELVELVASQVLVIAAQAELIEKLTARVAELERRLGADSSNSSRPPSSDSPFTKKPAKARSSRQVTGRKPGKQPGDPGVSRSLSDHPDQVVNIDPPACAGCSASLTGAVARLVDRRQIVDLPPVAAPVVTEYRLGAKTCRCCGTETTAAWTDNTDVNTDVLATPGSPVRIGPAALAMCAYLTCAHYLPVGRATALLQTLTGAAPGHRVHRPGPPTRRTQTHRLVPATPAATAGRRAGAARRRNHRPRRPSRDLRARRLHRIFDIDARRRPNQR